MPTTDYDNRATVTGTRTDSLGTTNSVGYVGEYGSLTSQSNPRPYMGGAAFRTTRTTTRDGFVTGTTGSGQFAVSYNNYRVVTPSHPGILPPTGLTAADLLAQTNPSKPIVDVPVFLFELRELPQLVKLAGDTLLKKGASANLSYEFGWKPLLNDLGGLLNIQDSVNKRAAHLTRLHESGGKSYKGQVGLTILPAQRKQLGIVAGGGILDHEQGGFCRRWISVSWKPVYSTISGMPSASEIRSQAFRSALGLTVDASTVWNALPWTWLLDWFSNLGAYLESQRNLVGFIPGQCFVMTHTELTTNYFLKQPSSLNLSMPSFHRVTKERATTLGSSLSASMPFLSARQAGILTSLAILRR
jgi:hypothetical protein